MPLGEPSRWLLNQVLGYGGSSVEASKKTESV